MFKILLLAGLAYLVYLVFFKKNSLLQPNKEKEESEIVDDMVECTQCSTYISQSEAILSQGKYFCSQTCLKDAS